VKKCVFFILTFLCFLQISCNKPETNETGANREKLLPLKIGIITVLTGNQAGYGEAVVKGCKLAASEINKKKDLRIELIIEDSAGEPLNALNSLKKLIDKDKVSAILGPLLSSEMKIVGAEANYNKIAILATSNTAKGIPQIGEYVFRNSLPESKAVPAAIKKAIEKLNIKKTALYYDDDDAFTKSSAAIMLEAAKDMGLEVLTTESFHKPQTDFKTQLAKIKKSNPDAVLCSALYSDGVMIMTQARQMGLNIPFIGGNGFNSPKIIELAKENAEGLIVATPWFSGTDDPAAKTFIKSFQDTYGENPDQFSAQAYDGIYLLAEAAKNAGSGDRKMIRDSLAAIRNFDGALGRFAFDEEGDVLMNPKVITVKDGKFQLFE